MNSFEIALKTNQLPSSIDDLVPLSFIGQEAVKFYKSKVKLMDKLDITEEQKQKTLKDGQDAGIMLLEIESRIGELLKKDIPENSHININTLDQDKQLIHNSMEKSKRWNARAISNNPEIVQESIQEAIENDDIPTKTQVLNKIKHKRELERKEKAEKTKQENVFIQRIEVQEYILQLEDVIRKLPTQPPKNLTEKEYNLLKGYVEIIQKRLEYFNE